MSEPQDDTRPIRKKTDRFLLSIGDHETEGAELDEIIFDPDRLLVSEAVAIERTAGLTFNQLIGGLNIGAGSAVRAAVWVMRKRSNPKLKLDEVEFSMGDFRNLDPDYRPEYGGIPRGAAFGDPWPEEPEADDVAEDNEGEAPKASGQTPPSPPLPETPVG